MSCRKKLTSIITLILLLALTGVKAMEPEEASSLQGKFFLALRSGTPLMVARLIERGADVNQPNAEGERPLDRALMRSNREILDQLLQAGAEVTYHMRTGETPLVYAEEYLPGDIIQDLIIYGAERDGAGLGFISEDALEQAAAMGDVNSIQAILRVAPERATSTDALLYAAGRGHLRALAIILGFNPDLGKIIKALGIVEAILRRQSLSQESRARYEAIRDQLINRLPLREQILWRQSLNPVLHALFIARRRELPRELQERAFEDVNKLLLRAARVGNLEQVDYALAHGADPDATDFQGRTALWLVAFSRDPAQAHKIVKLLLSHGAFPNPSFGSRSLLESIRRMGRREIAELIENALRERGTYTLGRERVPTGSIHVYPSSS
jgi:ankyrin repeat protein